MSEELTDLDRRSLHYAADRLPLKDERGWQSADISQAFRDGWEAAKRELSTNKNQQNETEH